MVVVRFVHAEVAGPLKARILTWYRWFLSSPPRVTDLCLAPTLTQAKPSVKRAFVARSTMNPLIPAARLSVQVRTILAGALPGA